MMRNYLRIKIFFFLFFVFSPFAEALEAPKPKARPEKKITAYQDVFDQIKKQNWAMAVVLAEDHNNKFLTSYIKWLDFTRPGSNHSFYKLKKFYKKSQTLAKNKYTY